MKKLTSLAALLFLAATVTARAEQMGTQQPAPAAAPAQAAPGDKPQSLDDKASYIIGFNLGSNLKKQEIPVNGDLIVKGLRDGLGGAPGLLTDEEIQAVMTEFQQKMMAQQQAKMTAAGEKNKKEADAFLASNKTKQGVVTTASGLQYQIVQEGTGPTPKPTDQVTVHYKGALLDGKVFDSSYDRNEPATFIVSQVIPGWVEALQLMKVGTKAKLFIPPTLAYGEAGAGQDIGPNSLLIFDVELIKTEAPPNLEEPEGAAPSAGGAEGQPQVQSEQKPPQR